MKLIFTLFLAGLLGSSYAQSWNFTIDANPIGSVEPKMTVSSFSRINNSGTTAFIEAVSPSTGPGASGGNNMGANAVVGTAFLVTLTPDAGFIIKPYSMSFRTRSTTSGATAYSISTSADNYTTTVTGTITNNSTWASKSNDLSTLVPTSISTPITIKIEVTAVGTGTATTNNLRIDDVNLRAIAVEGNFWDAKTLSPTVVLSNISAGNIAVLQTASNQLPTATGSTPSYPNASAGNHFQADVMTGAFDPNTSTYFTTTLTPATGFGLSLSKISFGSFSTLAAPGGPSGPIKYLIDININGAVTQIMRDLTADNNWQYIEESGINLNGGVNEPIIIKIYGYDATDFTPGVKWNIDDLTITAIANAVTPLTLLDFYATVDKNPLLKWITANEINVKEFVLERSSDGNEFASLAFVNAKSNIKNEYSYSDVTARGKQFYRLKMIDLDGSFTYSKIISTETKDLTDIYKVAGLPILRINRSKKQLIIYDMNGRKVFSAFTSDPDISIAVLPKNRYYFAEITENNVRKKIKFFND